MASTPRQGFDTKLRGIQNAAESGEIAEADAEAIRELCAAYDAEDATVRLPSDLYDARNRKDGHKKYRTLEGWAERLGLAAKAVTLTDGDPVAINEFTTGLIKDDDGPGAAWVRGIEYALKKFYRYHEQLGVDPKEITVHEYQGSTWDARDMLDADERQALRTVADNPRDLAVYHLAIYTGLRNTALRTLRVGDIDLENHEWYFNTDADGLKDIHDPREPRPLFQAERAVREWLDYHPTGEDGHYLITGMPKWTDVDPTTPVTRETIRRVMEKLKERTAERQDVVTVSKPCHPHMMRHNFVSMCLRHPDISDGDIKFYLGHAPGSNVMETTYGHLSSEDHNKAGHSAFGVKAADTVQDSLDPWDTTCSHCDRVLHPTEDACEACGTDREATPWDDASPSTLPEVIRETILDMAADPDPDADVGNTVPITALIAGSEYSPFSFNPDEFNKDLQQRLETTESAADDQP